MHQNIWRVRTAWSTSASAAFPRLACDNCSVICQWHSRRLHYHVQSTPGFVKESIRAASLKHALACATSVSWRHWTCPNRKRSGCRHARCGHRRLSAVLRHRSICMSRFQPAKQEHCFRFCCNIHLPLVTPFNAHTVWYHRAMSCVALSRS
jgi:hypothetical protein